MNETDPVIQWIRWFVSVPLLALFACFAIMNASIIWEGSILKRKSASVGPFLGGLVGTVGLLVIPVPGAALWWWLPLLLDGGNLPLMWYTIAMSYFDTRPHLCDVREGKDLPALPVISIWFAVVALPLVGYAVLRSSAWLAGVGWTVGSVFIATCVAFGFAIVRQAK